MASEPGSGSELSTSDRERLAELRSADSLADLVALTGAGSEHEAYLEAKREWRDLRERELASLSRPGGLPGDCVVVDGTEFCVHGVTHADTAVEREFLHEHVSRLLEAGAAVSCEQGIRPMYFADFPDVCAMDDYRWAMAGCEELDVDTRAAAFHGPDFAGLDAEMDDLAESVRDTAFSLIDSGSDLYGEEYTRTLGDVASSVLTSHEDLATGTDFRSFRLSRRAARSPEKLPELQRYYATSFLPQPIEREWLRRHDRELELVTHARNERMADYAVFHGRDTPSVHLIVGAAHQPGVTYYLDQHRVGRRTVAEFEPVD